ncbi:MULTISPECIES: peptidase U32 family protein [unclassified Desulfovibrio]|uniref:peptidase U32 family protein n=1 Tax=unclassified Desulfovibrio TaxID=2593640 RepID=UPI0013E9E198|nr:MULTISPECIES: peptidase U32 family protein [unclassified Desulfovibrio]
MSAATPDTPARPEILAPAGDTPSFLAALAAGADAVYVGLKHFSARMEAENFGVGELTRLTDLAHEEGRRVYVAMNTLIKPGETGAAWRLVARLARRVEPDGLILQDPGLIDIARQAGFTGGLALSTLANVTHPLALEEAKRLGASRVILPRELSIDEIRAMGAACPEGLDLELFVQGALCYCVSGRCYWSSYMGGKSGLRGRCVQPCRRVYSEVARQGARPRGKDAPRRKGAGNSRPAPSGEARPTHAKAGGKSGRFFSCRDLELGPLVKTLLDVPHLASWKIEGRKKGPHYVFHTVTAYRLLRDHPGDPAARKTAQNILELALGRPGVKARFLPQSPEEAASPDKQTSSGLLAGKVRITPEGGCELKPHLELLAGDYLRVGVEDERWHATLPVTRRVPKAGTLRLKLAKHATPKAGTPVYLIDRREPELQRLLGEWRKRLDALKEPPAQDTAPPAGGPRLPKPARPRPRPDMLLTSGAGRGKGENSRAGGSAPGRRTVPALWLSPRTAELSRTLVGRTAWWLPPVVWPEEEAALARMIERLWREGARHFVCNSPWQRAFFPERLPEDADLLAGPFCNIANAAALAVLAGQGFAGAFVSPELSRDDALALPAQSPLPLGAVISGFWPVGISRFGQAALKPNEPFMSPKGEVFWTRRYGGTLWIYPAWPLDLSGQRHEMRDAGYSFFARMEEAPPQGLPELRREGLFNWNGALL